MYPDLLITADAGILDTLAVYLKRAKGRELTRIREKELADLIGNAEAQHMLSLPRPKQVWISDGRIWIESDRLFVTRPLASSDLFMSFAKLAAHGEPSEARIKRWVSRFGLPVREAPRRRGHIESEVVETDDQECVVAMTIPGYDPLSMDVREFREEARYAHELLDVYLEYRGDDAAGIRARVEDPKSRLDNEFCEAFKDNRRRWGLYPGPDTGRELPGGTTYQELRDGMILQAARCALGEIATKLVSSVRLRAGVQDMRGLAPSLGCPDLLSAIYLHFYLLVTKSKPIRYCENCGQPFEARRSNKRFCDASCRSGIRYEPRQA